MPGARGPCAKLCLSAAIPSGLPYAHGQVIVLISDGDPTDYYYLSNFQAKCGHV